MAKQDDMAKGLEFEVVEGANDESAEPETCTKCGATVTQVGRKGKSKGLCDFCQPS